MTGENIHVVIRRNTAERLRKDVDMFRAYMRSIGSEMLKQEGALAAKAFMLFSAPIAQGGNGLEIGAKKQGEYAVEQDIRSIFKKPSDVIFGAADPSFGSMSAFVAWKQNKRPTGNDVLGKIWDDTNIQRAYQKARNLASLRNKGQTVTSVGEMRAIHEAQRTAFRGRIRRHRGPTPGIKRNPYVATAGLIASYVKQRQAKVGWTKAGWWAVIQSIGTFTINGVTRNAASGRPTIGGWVKRHGSGAGGRNRHDKQRMRFTIINDNGDADGVATENSVVSKVMQYRLDRQTEANAHRQAAINKGCRLWNQGRVMPRS